MLITWYVLGIAGADIFKVFIPSVYLGLYLEKLQTSQYFNTNKAWTFSYCFKKIREGYHFS